MSLYGPNTQLILSAPSVVQTDYSGPRVPSQVLILSFQYPAYTSLLQAWTIPVLPGILAQVIFGHPSLIVPDLVQLMTQDFGEIM